MHDYFQSLAADIARERHLEADNWRLVAEARRGEVRPGFIDRLLVHRLLGSLAGPRRQPTPTPTFSSDTCEAA